MKVFRILALAATCLCGPITSQTTTSLAPGPTVDLGYAKFEGVTNETVGVTTYFGVRYAAPPVGEYRFRAPQSIESSDYYNATEVVNATAQGPICVQEVPQWLVSNQQQTAATNPGSEDCLLADVLVPQNPAGTRLPVMVQIHGGGYTIGNGESYPGFALVNQSEGNLIYVTIQYRLGNFGFLNSQEVRENGDANAGLLDQRAALDWVQRNIRAFGGDPAKVTIIGGSAGGGSVTAQLILYGGEQNPPFRAAIAEYPWWQPFHNNSLLEEQYRETLTASNCTDIQCLRGLSTRALAKAGQDSMAAGYAARPMNYGYGDFYYGPSVDGKYIKDLPSNEFKRGHFSKVPLLVDHDQYEGVVFSNRLETTVAEETTDLQALFPYAKQSFFNRLYTLYPPEAYNSTFFQRQEIFGDFIISCPTYYMARAASDWGQPTWKLDFNAGSQVHGATVDFLFSQNATEIGNLTIGYIMKDWFLSFALNLDPNVQSFTDASKPYWPQYIAPGSNNFTIMDVNYTQIGIVQDFDAKPGCDFFHAESYEVRN